MSKKECDDLAGKMANSEAVLNRIARNQSGSLNAPSLRALWDVIGSTSERTGYVEEGSEMTYRLLKSGLDAAGNRQWRKTITAGYKSAAPIINRVGNVLTAIDVVQLGMDINDQDGLMFISHSAELGLGLMQKIPGMGAVILGSRIGIHNRIDSLQQDVDGLEASSSAAYDQETSRNVILGKQQLGQWQRAYTDGGCYRF